MRRKRQRERLIVHHCSHSSSIVSSTTNRRHHSHSPHTPRHNVAKRQPESRHTNRRKHSFASLPPHPSLSAHLLRCIMSLIVSSSFSHTSSSPLSTASISCSFQVSPSSSSSCHPSPATSPIHCVPPQLSSASDYRPATTTPQRPSLSVSTTYFSSSSTSSCPSSAAVHCSSPRSPALAPVRPSSAPSPSLLRSRSPVAQLSLSFSSSLPLHPVPSHHPFLHRSCGSDTCASKPSSPGCAIQAPRSDTVCRPAAASVLSPSTSCHAAFACVRVHVAKRYSDQSEYEGSAAHTQTPQDATVVLSRRLHSLTCVPLFLLVLLCGSVRCVVARVCAMVMECLSTDMVTDTADSGRSAINSTRASIGSHRLVTHWLATPLHSTSPLFLVVR